MNDYIIICDYGIKPYSTQGIEKQVSAKKAEGYQTCGGIFVVPEINGNKTIYRFFQAMEKKE